MVIVPDSNIILIKSPLKLDDTNQITFSNETEQREYFQSLETLEVEGMTYIRKDGVIRVPTDPDGLTFEELLTYNYCMYKNNYYSNKYFYAFITDITYVNDGMTEIKIETDAFQTWQFDLSYKDSFIEREHVSNDSVGLHTIPEGLEHGEYIINVAGEVETGLDECYAVVETTFIPEGFPGSWTSHQYGGVFSGCYRLAFDILTPTRSASLNNFIKAYDKLAKADSILSIYMSPKSLCEPLSSWHTGTLEGYTITVAEIGNTTGAVILRNNNINLTLQNTLNGYTPRNKKLLCYPYNMLSITNNSGTNAEFHYEDFIDNNPLFSLVGVTSVGNSIKLYPTNYKKHLSTEAIRSGYNFGITAGKYPTCSWVSDPYTNWLTQEAVNQGMAILGSPIQGMLTGSIGTGALGMAGTISNIMGERYTHSLQPPQAHGTNSGNINFAMSQAGFTYYKMSIKEEYARSLDDFFDFFGYKVNRRAIPNIHKRTNWDYIKCINVNIEGDVPERDLDEIRNLFNNGCTFWHTTEYFLDYSRTNSIL